MIRPSVEVIGQEKFMRQIKAIQGISKLFAPIMLAIALRLENDAKSFISGSAPREAGEPDTRPAMSEWGTKAAETYGARNIGRQQLGILYNSLRSSIKGFVTEITEEYITCVATTTNDIEYARIHELGGTIITKWASIDIPARPYMLPSLLKNREWIEKTLYVEAQKIIKGA
jgi:phage gpG-like protein